jgi:hypothetical protein
MSQKIKQDILRSLLAADGVPMPEASLVSAVEILSRPAEPTQSAITTAIKQLQSAGMLIGENDEITGTVWVLTTSGLLKARQIT